MSSSLRNFFTVENALEEFGPGVIRTFLLSTTYADKQTYSRAALQEATERYDRLTRGYEQAIEMADCPAAFPKATDQTLREAVATARGAFKTAMNDDFNTREALAALDELTTAVFTHTNDRTRYDYQGLRRAIETFEELGGAVLGLPFGATTDNSDIHIAEDLVELVLELREAEREAGNYSRADDLRDSLQDLGIDIEDTDDGPTYRL